MDRGYVVGAGCWDAFVDSRAQPIPQCEQTTGILLFISFARLEQPCQLFCYLNISIRVSRQQSGVRGLERESCGDEQQSQHHRRWGRSQSSAKKMGLKSDPASTISSSTIRPTRVFTAPSLGSGAAMRAACFAGRTGAFEQEGTSMDGQIAFVSR